MIDVKLNEEFKFKLRIIMLSLKKNQILQTPSENEKKFRKITQK